MAIFGRSEGRCIDPETGEIYVFLLREGNSWDVFLNYFFGLLFVFCLGVGVTVNPFIVFYHFKQKRTFVTLLFILISLLDLIKSLYFPVVLIPKLFSTPTTDDFYYDCILESVSWVARNLNRFLAVLGTIETYLLIALCIARYLTIKIRLGQLENERLPYQYPSQSFLCYSFYLEFPMTL